MAEDNTEDTPRKGRSNAILTYETVEGMALGIQSVALKLDALADSIRPAMLDHETRIRAMEKTIIALAASRGTATWLFQAVWPVAATIMAVLLYLK